MATEPSQMQEEHQEGGDCQMEEYSPYNTVASYKVEKKIGRGQFSVVYRAKCLCDPELSTVAMKKIQVLAREK